MRAGSAMTAVNLARHLDRGLPEWAYLSSSPDSTTLTFAHPRDLVPWVEATRAARIPDQRFGVAYRSPLLFEGQLAGHRIVLVYRYPQVVAS